ncbi:MAE_28990/MAE_18760 family HEPN-like nuclease [Aquimarina macrocephali]|uniref:MAE_28990/MAE_18760 family HEPN-like nuclease n=1 Tax=Aquimarina macrocephali TaxID=666563 RepID=UPI003F678F0D
MKVFVQEIMADINWRVSELATIKSLPIKYNFRPDHKELQIKYSIPALYAIWEGFVKNTFTIYSNHLNSLNINRSEISPPLLTHQLDSECDFNNPRTAFKSKKKLVELIDNILDDTITIKPSVPTESNVNFKVLNRILERYCIEQLDDSYDRGLNRLLRFRNMIAHGENALTVNMTDVTEFISLIENLMLDLIINIEKSEANESYTK